MKPENKMKVDNLLLTKSLGKGAFGEVYLTKIDGRDGYFATKRLDRAYTDREENVKRLLTEIGVMQKIKHPNIVGLIETKKTKNHIYLVMEFCNGGDLTGCLRKYMEAYRKPFPEQVVQYLMRQIVSGLDALHSRNILHRDLKLDNILVCFKSEQDKKSLNLMNSIAKITDFGFATQLNKNQPLAFTVLGTPTNMEPQLLNNMENRTRNLGYDQKADIWSLGTLCYQMLVGRTPFCGTSMQDLFHKVKIGTYPLPTNLSRESIFFIEAMLQKDPKKRLSCKELLRHDFLTKSVSQFHTVNAGNIPGVVAQQGGLVNVNSGANIKIQNLGETVWDIFAQPAKPQTLPNKNNQYPQQYQNPQAPNYQNYPKSQGHHHNQGNQMNKINIPPPQQYQNQYQNQYPHGGVMPKMQMKNGFYYQ